VSPRPANSWHQERFVGALSYERRLATVSVAPAAEISKRNRGPHIRWHAEPRKARPQSDNEVTKSAKGHAHSSMKFAPVPYLYIHQQKRHGRGCGTGKRKQCLSGHTRRLLLW